jgi:hypothetical protein
MIDDKLSPPQARDFPRDHSAPRRRHLVTEAARSLGDERRSLRPQLAAAVAVAVTSVAVATPALGLDHRVINLFKHSGTPATSIDLANAQRLVAIPSLNGRVIALWEAPNEAGGGCTFLQVAPLGATPDASGRGICSPTNVPQPATFQTILNWGLGPDMTSPVVWGHVADGSGVARVELTSASGSTPLAFNGGYFLGRLPSGGTTGHLPPGGPFAIVGYDSAGGKVAAVDLGTLIHDSTP